MKWCINMSDYNVTHCKSGLDKNYYYMEETGMSFQGHPILKPVRCGFIEYAADLALNVQPVAVIANPQEHKIDYYDEGPYVLFANKPHHEHDEDELAAFLAHVLVLGQESKLFELSLDRLIPNPVDEAHWVPRSEVFAAYQELHTSLDGDIENGPRQPTDADVEELRMYELALGLRTK